MSSWKRIGTTTTTNHKMIACAPYIMTLIVLVFTLTPVVYAKGKPDNPGNSGNAPGQSEGSPGNSGNAPGQGGDSPGRSGNAPGQMMREVSDDARGQARSSREEFLLYDYLNSSDFGLSDANGFVFSSSKHDKLRSQIEMVVLAYELKLISKSEAETRTQRCLDEMEELTRPGKFLGFLHRCRGLLCK